MAERRLITISYTGLDAGGGVPAFNRALHAAFPDRERHHFCWTDFPWYDIIDRRGETEWGRARILNEYLVKSREITTDDVVVVDGFWGIGLFHLPLAVSHSHGIWSHLTHADVQAGKQPDMPQHHAAQVDFRRRWTNAGKRLTAVSNFISHEMKRQWGFESTVINNGVDTELFKKIDTKLSRERPIIVHAINDRTNLNKGWDHISYAMNPPGNMKLDCDFLSIDEICERFHLPKHEALAQGDVFLHPSGFEGNSMAILEALACGLPVVGYAVGYLFDFAEVEKDVIDDPWQKSPIGEIIPLYEKGVRVRSPERTFRALQELRADNSNLKKFREGAAKKAFPLKKFRSEWVDYIGKIECV